MLKAIGLALPFVLAGCITSDIDDQYCRSIGATPGTSTYVNCRLARDQIRTQRAAISTAIFNANRAARPRTCTSTRVGSTIQTNCY